MPQSKAKVHRLRLGLTLRDLADECAARGVPADFGQLGRYERSEATPNPKLRAILAEILDLDVMELGRTGTAAR